MKPLCLSGLLILAVCGCSTPHVPVISKSDALLRADVSRLPGPSDGEVRLQLPANNTGTGRHDFYNLFAQYHKGREIIYGLSLATSTRHSDRNTSVLVNGYGRLPATAQVEVPVLRASKVNYLEVIFPREFVEQAAKGGRSFNLQSARGTYEFFVPDWMFTALLEGLERSLPELRRQSFNVAEVMYREDMRATYVASHPEKPAHIQDSILEGEVVWDMSRADVLASWGEPEMKLRGRDEKGAFEVWRYPRFRLVLENGVVTGWSRE